MSVKKWLEKYLKIQHGYEIILHNSVKAVMYIDPGWVKNSAYYSTTSGMSHTEVLLHSLIF